tara:strand:+ start:1264 stop:1710 length:447 start_codon:yes stop_codon:yes gene_type:complete
MKDAIRLMFCTLEAAGFAPPRCYQTDAGLDQGVYVYAAVLDELTPAELSAAVLAWVRGVDPFWPKPGQLLALVEDLAESQATHPTDRQARQRWRARRGERRRILRAAPAPDFDLRPRAAEESFYPSRRRAVHAQGVQRQLEALRSDDE